MVEISKSKDEFEVFSHYQSPEAPAEDFSHLPPSQVSHSQEDPAISDAMGIQYRTRISLRNLMKSQAEGYALKKTAQTKPSTFLSTQAE